MGNGIAQVTAQNAKRNVILMDSSAQQVEKALKFIG
jgi:3-hydroxyacyl-CoA dehydrogenase